MKWVNPCTESAWIYSGNISQWGGGMPQAVAKYGNFLATPYVLHTADLVIDDGISDLPLYMTGLL